MAASISSRLMPSRMSGFWAIDLRVTWGTRSYTNPLRMSDAVGPLTTWPVSCDSLRWPSGVSAMR